jgi:hypothetical protein
MSNSSYLTRRSSNTKAYCKMQHEHVTKKGETKKCCCYCNVVYIIPMNFYIEIKQHHKISGQFLSTKCHNNLKSYNIKLWTIKNQISPISLSWAHWSPLSNSHIKTKTQSFPPHYNSLGSCTKRNWKPKHPFQMYLDNLELFKHNQSHSKLPQKRLLLPFSQKPTTSLKPLYYTLPHPTICHGNCFRNPSNLHHLF